MAQAPLADRIRPKRLNEFVGQEHLVGKSGVIRKLLRAVRREDFFPSLIFWGPPGSGKTTLARIIANELKRDVFEFSAVNTSIKQIEKVIPGTGQKRGAQLELGGTRKRQHAEAPVVIIDEIHRFNKAQQAALLPHVETGRIILVGATTENPSFEVIGPLLSRTRVLVLKQHTEKELESILNRGTKQLGVKLAPDAEKFLLESSNGDARVLLTVLEIAANISPRKAITVKHLEEALQKRQLTFDLQGDEYYNTISAYIKSMRASNVDAALYYLARMVEAGQDPLYIARRMVVFASEDVGMADPQALVVANEVFRACDTIGYPECAINLAHGTVYLARAPKDRSAYEAYGRASEDARRHGNLPIPLKILNAPTKLMKNLGYGKGYEKYTREDLLPDKLKGKKYFKE